jgi:hypothetical protein
MADWIAEFISVCVWVPTFWVLFVLYPAILPKYLYDWSTFLAMLSSAIVGALVYCFVSYLFKLHIKKYEDK